MDRPSRTSMKRGKKAERPKKRADRADNNGDGEQRPKQWASKQSAAIMARGFYSCVECVFAVLCCVVHGGGSHT